MDNSITFLGTRGSITAVGEVFSGYGRETSCYAITMGETTVLVDCGTGVAKAQNLLAQLPEIHLLITHPHIDHLCGVLHLSKIISGKPLHVYGVTRDGKTIKDQIDAYMGGSNWPVLLDQVLDVQYHEIEEGTFAIGDIRIEHMEINHPGGCTSYRLSGNGGSLVIATDFNHGDGQDQKMIEFAKDADLLVYDGSMSEVEYSVHSDWGHSTPDEGAYIAEQANVKKLAITHHNTGDTDKELDTWEHELREIHQDLFFAYNGLTYILGAPTPGYCCSGKTTAYGDKLHLLMDICARLTSEKDRNRLFGLILRSAMDVTSADAGTLYLEDRGKLKFTIMITKSLGIFKGGRGDKIDLPPVEMKRSNVCAAAALDHRTINIEDVYVSDEYDFSGPRNYDAMTGYRTKSVLVVPMINLQNELVGVLQLINSTDGRGTIGPFDREDEDLVEALASQASIAIANVSYSKQITDLLHGFVRGISTGIDARTPYNTNHTRNMAAYCKNFLVYERDHFGRYYTSEAESNELIMAVWLHDVGKLATPLSVMDKQNRLSMPNKVRVENRFERMVLLADLALARGELDEVGYQKLLDEYEKIRDFVRTVDQGGYLSDDDLRYVERLGRQTYVERDGSQQPILTAEEVHQLAIRKGTLTTEERMIMQDHVAITAKILGTLSFPTGYKNVTRWASNHHEFLDGSGYPNGLTARDLSWQDRLLTIIDIFDALTAADRPYRAAMEPERAVGVLYSMVDEGKLDGSIVSEFERSRAWENVINKKIDDNKLLIRSEEAFRRDMEEGR